MSGQKYVLTSHLNGPSSNGSVGAVAWKLDQLTASKLVGAVRSTARGDFTASMRIENDHANVFWYEGPASLEALNGGIKVGFSVPILPAMANKPKSAALLVDARTGYPFKLVGLNGMETAQPVLWSQSISFSVMAAMAQGISIQQKDWSSLDIYRYGVLSETVNEKKQIFSGDIDEAYRKTSPIDTKAELEKLAEQSGIRVALQDISGGFSRPDWAHISRLMEIDDPEVSGSAEIADKGLLSRLDETIGRLVEARARLADVLIHHALKEVDSQRDYKTWRRLDAIYGRKAEEESGVKRRT